MGKRESQKLLSPAELVDLFRYEEDSGLLIWIKPKGRVKVGSACKSLKANGYLQVEVSGRNYLVHRIIWALKTGSWPDKHIDHVDGNRSNNRWTNLRDVSQGVNMQNLKRAKSQNKLGLLGVIFHRNRYRAVLQANGKVVHRSYHSTAEEAHIAYLKAKRRLHEGNTL